MMPLVTGARKLASKCLFPLARRAAKAYVAGERIEDAIRVADALAERGLGVALGYWDAPDDPPRQVANACLEAIQALAGREHAYLSIKLPSLGYSQELLAEIVEHAAFDRVRLHFDALAPETAERTRALVDQFLDAGVELSYTLPGRWARSVDDAAWAAERQIVVRVVKGQWVDPADPRCDLRGGFLRVIDALAGRARHVAVASHDVSLATDAIGRLRRSSTSCGLELLYGLPMRASLEQADWLALGVHVYVPYGKAYLPYALSRACGNPRIAWWLLRDLFLGHAAGKQSDRTRRELVSR